MSNIPSISNYSYTSFEEGLLLHQDSLGPKASQEYNSLVLRYSKMMTVVSGVPTNYAAIPILWEGLKVASAKDSALYMSFGGDLAPFMKEINPNTGAPYVQVLRCIDTRSCVVEDVTSTLVGGFDSAHPYILPLEASTSRAFRPRNVEANESGTIDPRNAAQVNLYMSNCGYDAPRYAGVGFVILLLDGDFLALAEVNVNSITIGDLVHFMPELCVVTDRKRIDYPNTPVSDKHPIFSPTFMASKLVKMTEQGVLNSVYDPFICPKGINIRDWFGPGFVDAVIHGEEPCPYDWGEFSNAWGQCDPGYIAATTGINNDINGRFQNMQNNLQGCGGLFVVSTPRTPTMAARAARSLTYPRVQRSVAMKFNEGPVLGMLANASASTIAAASAATPSLASLLTQRAGLVAQAQLGTPLSIVANKGETASFHKYAPVPVDQPLSELKMWSMNHEPWPRLIPSKRTGPSTSTKEPVVVPKAVFAHAWNATVANHNAQIAAATAGVPGATLPRHGVSAAQASAAAVAAVQSARDALVALDAQIAAALSQPPPPAPST